MSEPASTDSWSEPIADISQAATVQGNAKTAAEDFDSSSDFIEAVRGLYGEPPADQATSTQRSSLSTQGIKKIFD